MQAKYGLPENVEFCSSCVISNQRPSSVVEHLAAPGDQKPTIQFVDGVCSACLEAERKALVDWTERGRELEELCNAYRRTDGRYDVLVPGSGGKDSIMAADILKNSHGMHPLTCTWAPHIYTQVGRRNHARFCGLADNVTITPNERVHRLLTRLSLEQMFHPFAPFIYGQKAFPPRLADRLGIKLVMYGESGAEYGNRPTKGALVDDAFHVVDRAKVRLAGIPIADLLFDYDLEPADVAAYFPMEGRGPDVHQLGYYVRWKPQDAYYYACRAVDFEPAPERTAGTYSRYNSIDDKVDDLHYWTTFIKFGLGRASYDAAQEVRSGDITRDEAVALVKKFDGEYPERWEEEVFDYLTVPGSGLDPMTRERLFMLAERFKSDHLWDGENLRHTVWD